VYSIQNSIVDSTIQNILPEYKKLFKTILKAIKKIVSSPGNFHVRAVNKLINRSVDEQKCGEKY